jgi:hypothetical protein
MDKEYTEALAELNDNESFLLGIIDDRTKPASVRKLAKQKLVAQGYPFDEDNTFRSHQSPAN